MRSFLKYTLATIVGVLITVLLFTFIGAGIIGSMASSAKDEVKVEANSILKMDFSAPIVERQPENPFAEINFGDIDESGKLVGLNEILKTIKYAKEDDKIEGIFLNTAFFSGNMATLEEIRNALIDFKSSGKFIYSYAEVYTQGAYYLASVSDKIYVNPQGSIDFKGLNANVTFFKKVMDKLGIEMQIIRGRDNKFKSAVEPFMYTEMSKSNEAQMDMLLGSMWDIILENVSKERNIKVQDLQQYADKLTTADLEAAKSAGFVDGLVYYDQLLDEFKTKLEVEESKDLNFISLGKYNTQVKNKKAPRENRIAVIYAVGEIQGGEGNDEIIGSDRIAKAVREARKDSTIKAIVLRVNSPGGSALASDVMWRELVLAKQTKPLVVSMGDYAASGGYYISCMADKIVAQPNTLTGSIGVFGMFPNMQEFFNDKIGITFDGVKTAENADIFQVSQPMTEYQYKVIQKGVEDIYDTFLNHVADGRNMSVAEVDSIGQGRVWSGVDAKRIGLVDEIGGVNNAIEIAAEMAELDKYRIHELPKLKNPFEEFIKAFEGQTKAGIIKSELGDSYKYYQQIKRVKELKGYQARMPYFIDIN